MGHLLQKTSLRARKAALRDGEEGRGEEKKGRDEVVMVSSKHLKPHSGIFQ